MSRPTLEQILEAWWDLEVEEQDHSWQLTAVNRARTWSPNKDLLHPSLYLDPQGGFLSSPATPRGPGGVIGAPFIG